MSATEEDCLTVNFDEVVATMLLFINCLLLINPLNAELNPICHLLALLAHHILHISRIRVKGKPR
jgi:hypothetical protein